MKALGKIIFYLAAVVVLGALLAPPLFWGAQWLSRHGILAWLSQQPFRRYFHRAVLVSALLLVWPVARWLRVPTVHAMGLRPNQRFWQDVATGFAVSFLMMGALAAVLLWLHVAHWRAIIPWADLGNIAISAVVVSILEECLFRGAILGLLTRALPEWAALSATSALYSIVHFLKSTGPALAMKKVGWLSGFALLPDALARFREPWLVLGGFTTLFCVGWILGWSRLKTRSLAMPMGLHAGWILGIMGFAKVTWRAKRDLLPWFGEDLSVGLGSVAVVAITGGLVWALVKGKRGGETANGKGAQ